MISACSVIALAAVKSLLFDPLSVIALAAEMIFGLVPLFDPLSVIALAADMISLWLQCMFAFHCLLLFPHVPL